MRSQLGRHLAGKNPSSKRRKGVAAVEMAVCMPVIFLIIFGGIEASNMIFLKQAITEAAYEGALFASKPDATQSETISRVQAILDARDIQATTITAGIGSTPVDQLIPGQIFSIRITAATNANLISPALFATFSNIVSEIHARKL